MPTVLITGCSSGIGLDAARTMAARGWTVIATCRKPEDLAARAAEGMIALPLDLADHASVEAAVDAALEHVPVDALVNNAAFALPGAVEDLPRDGLRAISDATPVGSAVGALQDVTTGGGFPDTGYLLVMAAWTVVATAIAVRAFRWE